MFQRVSRLFLSIYKGLSPLQLFLLVIRLSTCTISLAFLLVTLIGPAFSGGLYISRIDCAHIDVALGLYNSLRNSVTSEPAANAMDDLNSRAIDSSVTNSEILILSSYAQAQVSNAPQYILTSFWKWCYGNYNITKSVDHNGKVTYIKYDDLLTCSRTGGRYQLDYVKEIEQVGLSAILAYAYKSLDFYDTQYNVLLLSRSRKYISFVTATIFAIITQFIVIIYTICLYSCRKYHFNLMNLPPIAVHVLGLLSIASCTSLVIGSSIITNLVRQIQREIGFKLGAFGISLHFGTPWFTCIWIATGLAIVNMISWAMPLWCANPEEEIEDEFEFYHRSNNNNNSGRKSNWSGIKRFKNRKTEYKNDHQYFNEFSDSPKDDSADEKPNDLYDNQDFIPKYDVFQDENKVPTRQDSRNFEYMVYQKEDAKQEELRKLGESLSKQSTVRQINKRKRPIVNENPIKIDEVQNLLYDNVTNQYSNYPQLHREQFYDGYNRTRSNTLDLINEETGQEYPKTRNLSNPTTRKNSAKTSKNQKDNNMEKSNSQSHSSIQAANGHNLQISTTQIPSDNIKTSTAKLLPSTSHEPTTPTSTNFSILNDDEILILNSNNVIN